MFWKIMEFIVRTIHFKHFRQAKLIGKTVKAAEQGKHSAAMSMLDNIEPKLDPGLIPIFWLVRGRILLSANRFDDAKTSFSKAGEIDPVNEKIKLGLVVAKARCFELEEARETVADLCASTDEVTKKQALELQYILGALLSGERQKELEKRAIAFSNKAIGPNGETPGMPTNLQLIDEWISRDGESAKESIDDLALLIGFNALNQENTSLKIGIVIDDFFVEKFGKPYLYPFDIAAKRFASSDARLTDLLKI